jgi:hypothetical protein
MSQVCFSGMPAKVRQGCFWRKEGRTQSVLESAQWEQWEGGLHQSLTSILLGQPDLLPRFSLRPERKSWRVGSPGLQSLNSPVTWARQER